MEQRPFINLARHVWISKQGLDLAGKQKAARLHRIVERLNPNAVPNQPQATEVRIPERESKHPAEPLNRIDAPLTVCVNNDLAVRTSGMKAMTQRFELTPELDMVVDFSIVGEPYPAVRI